VTVVRPDPAKSPVIHLFEPSGYAGVFQHTCRLAKALSAADRKVLLHTSAQHEDVPLPGVELCTCVWWPRPTGGSRLGSGLRRAAIARRLVTSTVPHLVRTRPAILHVQGVAATGAVNLLALTMARRAGHRVVYSPHDVFSRRGLLDGALLRRAYRVPHALVVHSRADERRLREIIGSTACPPPIHLSPLIQLIAEPTEGQRMKWRREWRADDADRVVLFAGFIRPEKRLDVLVESARGWPAGRRLAVVGPDRGGWARCDDLARAYDLDIAARLEFVDLDEFTAAIAAADLVVVPSELASQSGVLAVARQLRTPSVAADVGGMGELASRTFAAGDVAALSLAIQAVLSDDADAEDEDDQDGTEDEDGAVAVHLAAYGQAS
jgi:glycosyltransferase involved in cell wall biosynthesis